MAKKERKAPKRPKPESAATGRGKTARQARAKQVVGRARAALPEPRCELDFQNAWQLLVATILSAQSTDARVNMVTPALFARYPSPAALGQATLSDVEGLIRSTGFFRNKAKSIVGASKLVAERHGGAVPRTLPELIELPGVARKTANVVLGTAYGVASGIVVDTHAGRVARRLGLTREVDPKKVEEDLCALFPQREWVAMGHRLVLHGRYVCKAQQPSCASCVLGEVCPSAAAPPEGTVTERAKRMQSLVRAPGEH